MKLKHFLSPLLIAGALLLSACSPSPMDAPLLMGKGVEAYRLDLATRMEKLTPLEIEAFNWAVEGMTYDQLIESAPNKSPREVIRMALTNSKAFYDKSLPESEKAVAEYEAVREELLKIKARDISLRNDKGFFIMPKLKFSADNDSKYNIGTMAWVASLYINGSDKAEARYGVTTLYKNTGALVMESGSAYTENHNIGFVNGDPEWISQAVLRATAVEVRVHPNLEKIRDVDGKTILPPSPYALRESLKFRAEKHAQYGGI